MACERRALQSVDESFQVAPELGRVFQTDADAQKGCFARLAVVGMPALDVHRRDNAARAAPRAADYEAP